MFCIFFKILYPTLTVLYVMFLEEHTSTLVSAHLLVKVPRSGDSEGIFLVFESSCHLLHTCLTAQKIETPR